MSEPQVYNPGEEFSSLEFVMNIRMPADARIRIGPDDDVSVVEGSLTEGEYLIMKVLD